MAFYIKQVKNLPLERGRSKSAILRIFLLFVLTGYISASFRR